MASTGQLKRRLSGPGEKRSGRLSSSPQLVAGWAQGDAYDPLTPPSTSKQPGHRQRGTPRQLQQASEMQVQPKPAFELPGNMPAAKPTEARQSSWGLLKSFKLLSSDDSDDVGIPSFRMKGFEALGVVRRAADGLASTATTMATSLDEAVEQLFVGWTPAPPAPDHVPYETSAERHLHRKRILTASDKSAQSVPQQAKAATASKLNFDAQPVERHAADNGWEDWESPFGSRATSPEASAGPHPDQAQSAAAAPIHRAEVSSCAQGTMPSSTAPELQKAFKSAQADSHDRARTSGQDDLAFGVRPSQTAQEAQRDEAEQPGSPELADSLQAAHTQLQAAVDAAEKGHRRVVQLQRQLQDTQVSPDTLQSLRRDIEGALQEVATASQQCTLLSEKHQALLQRHNAAMPEPDPIADQVAGQLQALLTEKARLAQENARLARENTGLQELLQYTMHQHLETAEPMQNEATPDEFADWASLDSALPDGTALPSSQNGSPAKLLSTSPTRSPA